MYEAEFLRTVQQIKPVIFEDIGFAINFADIFRRLNVSGWSKDMIQWHIEELERKGKAKVFRSDSVIYAMRLLP